MSVVNGASDGGEQASSFTHVVAQVFHRSCRRRKALPQRAALHQFHAEEMVALLFANLEDRNDVRMIELGGSLGLDTKAADVRGGSQLAREDDFHRDFALQTQLTRAINDSHSATTEFLQNFVVAKIAHPNAVRLF